MRRNRPALFKGRHFEVEIIVLCAMVPAVSAQLAQLEEMTVERNLSVDHVTIWRGVQLPAGAPPHEQVVESR